MVAGSSGGLGEQQRTWARGGGAPSRGSRRAARMAEAAYLVFAGAARMAAAALLGEWQRRRAGERLWVLGFARQGGQRRGFGWLPLPFQSAASTSA